MAKEPRLPDVSWARTRTHVVNSRVFPCPSVSCPLIIRTVRRTKGTKRGRLPSPTPPISQRVTDEACRGDLSVQGRRACSRPSPKLSSHPEAQGPQPGSDLPSGPSPVPLAPAVVGSWWGRDPGGATSTQEARASVGQGTGRSEVGRALHLPGLGRK